MTEPTSSNYPSSLDSNVTLGGDAVNLTSLTLDTAMDASVTTVSPAEDITGVNVPCYLLCGTELIYATAKSGGNFTSCDRGAGGTTATSHSNGAAVYVVYAANQFNQLKRSIIAIETELGVAPSSAFSTVADRLTGLSYLAEGTMINGRLYPTVSSNNLTLALVTKDGSTPSATNPVLVVLGNTIRSVTSALSVTANAGTNWGNAAGAEMAGNEIDWFAYLGYNATDGVIICFSRIAGARKYGDFHATSTNQAYGKMSTVTAAASADSFSVVGRFAATLSGAMNWSIPSYEPDTLVQSPTRTSRQLYYTVVWSSDGTQPVLNNGSVIGRYSINDRRVSVNSQLLTGSGTTYGSSTYRFSLPFTITGNGTLGSIGKAILLDISFVAYYHGTCQGAAASNTVVIFAGSATSTASPTVPFTFAAGDYVWFDIDGWV